MDRESNVSDISSATSICANVAKIEDMFSSPPRCHFFRTSRRKYVYDANTGEIIAIDSLEEGLLKYLGQSDFPTYVSSKVAELGEASVSAKLAEIIFLSKERTPPLFSTVGPEEICFNHDFECYKHEVAKKLLQMTVVLTDACNLSCTYCVYSGDHPMRSQHGSNVMSIETLKRALEYFVEHTTESDKKRHFGFYGGEAILAFDHIKYATDYLENTLGSDNFTISTNSNFYAVTQEMMKYFIDHNFTLYISLDGPKHVHDRYRILPNGEGTFDRIMHNLNILKELDEQYFTSKVLLNEPVPVVWTEDGSF